MRMHKLFERVFVIAEVGMNHDGSLGQAKAFVDAAAECGVDAVKFQTHIFEAESVEHAPAPHYFTSESRKDFFRRTAFTDEQWQELKDYTEQQGLVFVSSPFSIEAVELLEKIGVTLYKVPSGEVTNIPYLEAIAETRKPVLLSTGMSSWEEIDTAVETIRAVHNDLVVLQCTSSYPCPYDEVGLNVLEEIRQRYGTAVGLSDHTLTIYASLAAVTLGAVVIEKHFTLSKKLYGPDAKFSLEPEEMKSLVDGVRAIEQMLRHPVDKDRKAQELREMKRVFEKSIVAAQDLDAGTILKREHLAFKKPGDGISPKFYRQILGRRLKRSVRRDEQISWQDLEVQSNA